MISAVRIVDTDDIAHETVTNDLVPRSLPSFTSSVVAASGLTVDRTGNGDYTHIKCIVDSPLITLSETAFTNVEGEDTLTITLRINNSTICNAKICADIESKQMALLLISNVSIHWIVWRFPFRDNERLLSGFPVGDSSAVFLPHRSFLFGSLISNASVSASSACLLPSSSEPMVFFAIAFDNGRLLFMRAPVLSGTDGPNYEHCFIEPTSLFTRLISLASSSQQTQAIVSLDAFGDFTLNVAGVFVLRSSHTLELYNITSKKRLSSCISGPAIYNCSGTPLLARIIDTTSTRFIGVLHRGFRDSATLTVALCKVSFLPKLTLSLVSEIEFSQCAANVSVLDFGLLSCCAFLACQTNDGTPLTYTVPIHVEGDSVTIKGSCSVVQYWRRPISTYTGDDEIWENETDQLTHSVLSADCGSVQLLRQLLQALRLPHMGIISSPVVASGISAALSARQALAVEMSSTCLNDTSSSRMAVESLSRKIENIWSKDRKILGVHVFYAKNFALIYHRHSVTAILPAIPVLTVGPGHISSEQNDLLDRVASAFYNNILSSSEGASISLFSSRDAVKECADSFLLTLDDDVRYAIDASKSSKLEWAVNALFNKSLEVDTVLHKNFACEVESLNDFVNSPFYRRLIGRFVLTNLDWLLSYSLALLCFQPAEGTSKQAEKLPQFVMVVRTIRSLLESPMPFEEGTTEDILASSSLSWVIDSFIEYALASSSILPSHLKDARPNATFLGNLLTKLLLPESSSFILEQFLLDNSLFAEFEALQKCIGSVGTYPGSAYRLYLYGLCALLRNQPAMALEYFVEAALSIDKVDITLFAERCRPHIAHIEKPEADFWIRILDLAQHFGCTEIAIEAGIRAKPFFLDVAVDTTSFARVLDMKLFKLQCQSFNFRGAIATLLSMKEDEDQMAAVNVIVSTAVAESKLLDLIDCLLIDLSSYSDEKINTLVATALHRALRSNEYPDWNVSWSLYRMNLSQNKLPEAASALFEYFARLPSLSTLTPNDFVRRRDALALVYCTLKMVNPPSERWLTSQMAKTSGEAAEIGLSDNVITLANIDELCRIEDARVELINACELPRSGDGMECDKTKRKESADGSRRPKFEEAAPIILRLGASDLVRWLSTAQLFGPATELCRALQLPCRDISAPLIDALCSKLDSSYNLLHESDLKACLLRLDDTRPTFHAIRTIYTANLELPSWLWRLAIRQDCDALLRATIKHKRLLDAGRISAVILENALTNEALLGHAAFSCCLPWWHLDRVIAALHEFVKISASSEPVEGALEIADVYTRLQGLCARYAKHGENIKRQLENAIMR